MQATTIQELEQSRYQSSKGSEHAREAWPLPLLTKQDWHERLDSRLKSNCTMETAATTGRLVIKSLPKVQSPNNDGRYGEFTVCPAQRLYQRLDVVDFSLDCTHQDLLVLRSVSGPHNVCLLSVILSYLLRCYHRRAWPAVSPRLIHAVYWSKTADSAAKRKCRSCKADR